MSDENLKSQFEKLGVLQAGHFRLTSGLHSAQYVQCAKLFEYPRQAAEILASFLPRLPRGAETVIAPAVGGITVGYELARLLGCRFVFAERQGGSMTLRRGFALRPGEKVLAAEDVITTGGSVREVIGLAEHAGAEILGAAAVVDRSSGKADLGVPLVSLLTLEIEIYQPENCPLCAAGLPVQRPGSRK